jgi:hypothetical protein
MMSSRALSPFLFASFMAAADLAATAMGCADPKLAASPSALGLPRWEAHDRQVFDDNIDPAAVGLSLDGLSPRSDPFLRERAQTAAVVSRVRVQTVTIDSVGNQRTYYLSLQVSTPMLTQPTIPDHNFELEIRSTSGAYGIAKAFDARLRGATFIAFIRRFSGEDGESEIHWHLSPDTAEVAMAVKEAVVLKELSGS